MWDTLKSTGCSSVVLCPFNIVVQKTACNTQAEVTPAQMSAGQSLALPGWQCWAWCIPGYSWPFGCQCKLLTYIQLAVSQNFRPLSVRMLSSFLFPSLYLDSGLPHPRCRIWQSNFMQLVIAQTSNLSRSLFKASLSSRESEAPPNLVLPLLLQLVLFRMHSSSASKLFVKILKRTGPNSEGLQNPTNN